MARLIATVSILILIAVLMVPYYLGRKRKPSEFEAFINQRKSYSEAEFYFEIESASLNRKIAGDFVERLNRDIEDHGYSKTVVFPKLQDDRYKVWGLDEDIEDVVNDVFEKNKIRALIKWNDEEVIRLRTIGEILAFIESKFRDEQSTQG